MERKELFGKARRLVIKLGTAVLIKERQGVALGNLYSFVEAIADKVRQGAEVLLVTSGAIGLGAQRLDLKQRPRLLTLKQACAAIGQGQLMAIYAEAFEKFGINVGQILLTEEDFANRRRYLNLRGTISELLHLGALPIINENDTVSTAELETDKANAHRQINFGDNDKLSALVASNLDADLLIILTDVDGLYNADPRLDQAAQLIPVVTDIHQIEQQLRNGKSTGSGSKLGRGGIKTKLAAAKVAVESGCAALIAGGKVPSILPRLFAGEELGTLFLPKPGLSGKLRWIAFASSIKAAIIVNEGARLALLDRKASLLPAGVVEVRESFDRGDVVSILDQAGREFARGMVNYSSDEARKVTGLNSRAIDDNIEDRNYDALVTRDNIAFLERKHTE
jgi:glutamate 5-kinase